MRQVGFIPDPIKAAVFEDYLLTMGISTKLDRQGMGWNIWVLDEDRLVLSRKELSEFLVDPVAEKYSHAINRACEIRQQNKVEEQEDESLEYNLEDTIIFPRMTLLFCLTCLGIGVPSLLSENQKELIVQYLAMTPNPALFFQTSIFKNGEIWRLITPVFLHFGWLHLIFNVVLLFDFGKLIEPERGALRFLAIFFVLAIVSNLAQFFLGGISWDGKIFVWLNAPIFGGMSGVIYGFLGYAWMKGKYQEELNISVSPQVVQFLLIWFGLCWTGLLGPVANIAHTFGLLAGIGLGLFPKKATL